jgi:hypothetical protein
VVQIESTFAQRVPAALTLKLKQAPELFASGMAEVDARVGESRPASNGEDSPLNSLPCPRLVEFYQ